MTRSNLLRESFSTPENIKKFLYHFRTRLVEKDQDARTLGLGKLLHTFSEAVGADSWHHLKADMDNFPSHLDLGRSDMAGDEGFFLGEIVTISEPVLTEAWKIGTELGLDRKDAEVMLDGRVLKSSTRYFKSEAGADKTNTSQLVIFEHYAEGWADLLLNDLQIVGSAKDNEYVNLVSHAMTLSRALRVEIIYLCTDSITLLELHELRKSGLIPL